MAAIGFGIIWFGYLVGLKGYCQVRGYDASWSDLAWPSSDLTWPPPAYPTSAAATPAPVNVSPSGVPNQTPGLPLITDMKGRPY